MRIESKPLLVFLVLGSLWAQSDANKGTIAGSIYDPKQAMVPNADIKIRNVSTGLARDLKSDEAGHFRAVLLDPGPYELSVSAAGFAPAELKGVTLNVGSSVDLDIVLQIGSVTQTVEVGATVVNIDLPAPSTVISSLAIQNLPINGRRFQDFALLTPTVQTDPERSQLSFVGQRGVNANVMVDGTDYNQPFFGGIRGGERSNFVITVPQTSIQEFQAVTAGYTAEYGRSTGGLLNVITKSGANDLHGEAFYQIRHKEMGLKTPFNRQILETLQQFGGGAGGALVRDKAFWYAAVERQLSKTPRQILFGTLAGIAPNANNSEALNFYHSLEGPFKNTNDAIAATGRGDYQFAGGSRLTLRYNFSDANAENAAAVGGAADTLTTNALTNNGSEMDRTHTGVAQLTSILSSSMFNDLRFATTYELRPRLANAEMPGVSNAIGQFGTRNFLPTTQDDRRIQINDSISLMRGGHSIKLGADYNYITAFQQFGFNQFGFFAFNTSDVPTILDILSVGGTIPNRFDDSRLVYRRQMGNLLTSLKTHQVAWFAQDSWRVTPRLMLNFGLRWEGQLNPEPDTNNTDLINNIRANPFPIGSRLDPSIIPDAMNQWMPRFGFTFTPLRDSNTTVIRGHAGIFYASSPLLLFSTPQNNYRLPPGDLSIVLPRPGSTVYRDLLAVGVDLNQSPLDRLPVIPADVVQRAFQGGQNADPFAGAAPIAIGNDFRNPRSFQAGLGFDHQIVRNFVAGVQFNYVNSVHLERNRDFNLPVPTVRDASGRPIFGVTATGAANVRRPLAQYASITTRESSARSMYRGMTLSTSYRGGRFQFGGFYTLSDAFSDDDSERTATGFNYDNSFNLRNEYGYSKLHARHQLAGYVVYHLPLGFEVSSGFRLRSGSPIDPAVGTDLNQDGSNTDRAYEAAGRPFGRNSYSNYAIRNIDLRVLKNFAITEQVRLQFSTEMFNLFNFDNVIAAGTNLNYGPGIDAQGNVVPVRPQFRQLKLANGDYDTINTQVGFPFQAQFGLRLFF